MGRGDSEEDEADREAGKHPDEKHQHGASRAVVGADRGPKLSVGFEEGAPDGGIGDVEERNPR